MKTKDIKVGEDYAFAENYEWDGRYGSRRATKARVLETGLTSSRYGGSGNKTHVRIEFERFDQKRIVRVPASQIREEWATYGPVQEAAEKARLIAAGETEIARIAMVGRLEALLPGIDAQYLPVPSRFGSVPRRVTMTHAELADLLEAVKRGSNG